MSRRRTPMKGGILPSFRELADLDSPQGPVAIGAAALPIAGPSPSPDVKTGSNHGLLPVFVAGWREWNRTTDPYRVKARQAKKAH